MNKFFFEKIKQISSFDFKTFCKLLVNTFKNFDKKIIQILKLGLVFCFFITIVSILILITYLMFIHSPIVYKIGILTFQISLYYAVFFVTSAITVDSISKTWNYTFSCFLCFYARILANTKKMW